MCAAKTNESEEPLAGKEDITSDDDEARRAFISGKKSSIKRGRTRSMLKSASVKFMKKPKRNVQFDLGSKAENEQFKRRSSHTGLSPANPEASDRKRCLSETNGDSEARDRKISWWSFLDEPQRQCSRIEFIDDRDPSEIQDEPEEEEEPEPEPPQEPEEAKESTSDANFLFPMLPFHLLKKRKASMESADGLDEIPVEPHLLKYIVSLLGYSVNLAALWRFPYLFHKHGGGAFMLAYAIVLLFIGFPVCFLETALGEFTSLGPVASWNCVPLLKGLGYASVAVCVLVALEMSVIMSWIWHYLFLSFEAEVPWLPPNSTIIDKTTEEKYFMSTVIQANDGVDVDGLGSVCWELSLCLVLIWFIMFLYLLRLNIRVEKSYYISFVIPFAALCVIFGAGLSVGRDIEGLQPIFSMSAKDLASGSLWLDAVSQLAWAMGMSNGVSVSVASMGMFPRSKGLSNTAIFLFGNLVISILASLTTSSHLGNIAEAMNTSVYTAVTPSLGSPFILYTTGMTILPVSTLWAILFFLVLIGVGIHSLCAITNTILMFLLERGPEKLRRRRALTLFLICLTNIFAGLIFVTQGGLYLLTILDDYCTSWSVCIIAIVECLTITYLYGLKAWIKDLSALGNKLKPFAWKLNWGLTAPCALLAVLIGSWVDYKPARFGGKELGRDMSSAANTAGIIIAVIPASLIPIYVIYKTFSSKGKSFSELLLPSQGWGPATKAKRWVIANLKNKYNINPDPVLMVKMDSLTGIPMGFYRYPESVTTRQRKVSQEALQKRLESILKKKLSSAREPNQEEKTVLTENKNDNKTDMEMSTIQSTSTASTCTVESEAKAGPSQVRSPLIMVTYAPDPKGLSPNHFSCGGPMRKALKVVKN